MAHVSQIIISRRQITKIVTQDNSSDRISTSAEHKQRIGIPCLLTNH